MIRHRSFSAAFAIRRRAVFRIGRFCIDPVRNPAVIFNHLADLKFIMLQEPLYYKWKNCILEYLNKKINYKINYKHYKSSASHKKVKRCRLSVAYNGDTDILRGSRGGDGRVSDL